MMKMRDDLLMKLRKSIQEKLDVKELMKEQNYQHPTREELEAIMKEADIQEPIEVLLEMI